MEYSYPKFRIGHGYDVHALGSGRPLILGGVVIPHHLGLIGHSDADVLSHAISDALLGALAMGSIGDHFPDTDPQFRGISSLILLKKVVDMVGKMKYKIYNIDATILAQHPKISPFSLDIRKSLATTIGILHDDISVKATTTENLGFEGRQEGISAHAVVLVSQ